MTSSSQTVGDWSDTLPGVELEVRHGSARGTTYTLDGVDFLIGTVPGCDLRVVADPSVPAKSKNENAAVLCLIARHPAGASLRKLALTQPVLVNGQNISHCDLADGDRVQLGRVEIQVHIAPARFAPTDISAFSAADEGFQDSVRQLRQQVVAFQQEKESFERQKSELAEARLELADLRRQASTRDDADALEFGDDQDGSERRQRQRDRHEELERRSLEVTLRGQRLEKDRRLFEKRQKDVLAEWTAKNAEL